MIRVSVVVPLYNKASHIERALCSVLYQTIQEFEVIVIDDGSTDGGGAVVKGINDSRIRLIRQDNAGVSAARNLGITKASGELVAFLDADDEWKPTFLETILRLAEAFPLAGAYATNYAVVEPNGNLLSSKQVAIPTQPWEGILPSYFRCVVGGGAPVWSSAVAIPKKVFKNVGGFALGERHGEDLDMWGRIAFHYPIAFSWEVGAVYYQDAENRACNIINRDTEWVFERSVEKAVQQRIIQVETMEDVLEYLAMKRLQLARIFLSSGNSVKARRVLKDCKTGRFFKQKVWLGFWALLPEGILSFVIRGKQFIKS